MNTIYTGVWSALVAVPYGAWLIWVVYTLTLGAIYFFGLPKHWKAYGTKVSEDHVAHGLRSTIITAEIFDGAVTEANAITLLGILGVIGMIVMTGVDYHPVLVLFFFCSAEGVSDWLDGLAAQRHRCHSRLGAFIDPLRDRLALAWILEVVLKATHVEHWLVYAFLVALFELRIALVAGQADCTLNSHGAGKVRQAVHLVMMGTIVVVTQLIELSPAYTEACVITAIVIMAMASAIAAASYVRRYGA